MDELGLWRCHGSFSSVRWQLNDAPEWWTWWTIARNWHLLNVLISVCGNWMMHLFCLCPILNDWCTSDVNILELKCLELKCQWWELNGAHWICFKVWQWISSSYTLSTQMLGKANFSSSTAINVHCLMVHTSVCSTQPTLYNYYITIQIGLSSTVQEISLDHYQYN
jgi:hypothetical protein